jgi:hypothetical protein
VACLAAGWTGAAQADAVTDWNALAAQCIALAPAPAPAGRAGPAQIVDLALVQIAVHDAVQAIERKYDYYAAAPSAPHDASPAAAAAAAAYRVLSKVCPHATATLDAAFAPYAAGNDPGLGVGYAVADVILAQEYRAPVALPSFTGGTGIGEWRPTPPALAPMAALYLANDTKPYSFDDPAKFRPGPPPPMASQIYLRDYNEVKKYGSIQSHPEAGACPAPRRTDTARFWSGNFAAQWNQAVRDIAIDRQLPMGETARLLALANIAGSDAIVAVWEAKVHYNFWRPITAIELGDQDPNKGTVGQPGWTPFIQAQNGHFPPGSQTPPYSDYVSGANGITAAFVTTLQLFFKTDYMAFEIEKATPPQVPICTNPRTFRRLSDAAQEVVDARIWLGIHFRFADEEARRLGTRVASWAFNKMLRPAYRHH